MKKQPEPQSARIAKRREQEEQNLFSRMPSVYAASRLQGQRILQAAGGLTVVEWRVLWDLTEAGPMTIKEMAEIQRIDHSQLSRALPPMRAKGFVVMRQDDHDGRQVLVDLAPAGRDAYAKARPIMERRRATLEGTFSKAETAIFIDFLDRFEAMCRGPIDPIINPRPKQ